MVCGTLGLDRFFGSKVGQERFGLCSNAHLRRFVGKMGSWLFGLVPSALAAGRSPFGLRSSLRQSGRRFAAAVQTRAEAQLYLRGKGSGNSRGKGKGNSNGNGNGKDEIQGSLHCALRASVEMTTWWEGW